MSVDKKAWMIAYLIFAIGSALAIWIVASLILSFSSLDWRSITDTQAGRVLLAILWIWLLFAAWNESKEKR
jgi:hypothetical protein